MKEYLPQQWQIILDHNGLGSFDELWALDAGWFEQPNQRRGGWSGVSRFEASLPEGGKTGLFIKRQQNHKTRTLSHPFGMPTFAREMANILRFRKHDIPTLTPVYYACRIQDNNCQAILITEELTGYISLEDLVQGWEGQVSPNRQEQLQVIYTIADTVRRMHDQHFQHNCFYPKHIFLEFDDESVIDIRIIDLEKLKWRPFVKACALRDLYTLNCHSQVWSRTDRLRFLLAYLQSDRLTPYAKTLWKKIVEHAIEKGRVTIQSTKAVL